MPDMQQAFAQKPQDCPAGLDFDRRLYVFRRIEEGRVSGTVLISLEPSADPEAGTPPMVPVAGSERAVPAQLVLLAAGFTGAESYVAKAFGVDLTPKGTVANWNSRINVERVFAAGDMRRGQSLAVDFYLMGYTNL